MFTGGIPFSALPGGRRFAWVLRLMGAGGLAAIAVAWSQAAGTVRVDEQLDWAPVGLAGVVAFSAAVVLSVVAARQAVTSRLAHLVPTLEGRLEPEADAVGRPVSGPTGPLVAAATMVRFHQPDCPLVAGKTVTTATRAEHEVTGRRPCGVCGS